MNPIIPLGAGQLIAVPNMRLPDQGAKAGSFRFDFTDSANLDGDLSAIFRSGELDFVQSVYIDNSSNASNFVITFPGVAPNGYQITAQPYTQGFYPITCGIGDGRFSVNAPQASKIPVIFYNVPLPYFVWGPVPGVLVVPALTNHAVNFQPLAAAANQVVAGVVGQTIKVYRLFYTLGGGANLTLKDSAGNNFTGIMNSFAGGGASFQPSGIPWFSCADGADFVILSDAAVNLGGAIGYLQS